MKKKRIALILLAAVLLAAALYIWLRPEEPPADNEVAEVPTLRILTIGESSPSAVQRTSHAISAITREELGCHVEIVMMRPSEYDEYIDNLVHNTEPADILVCTNREMLEALTSGNYIYRLDRHLEYYPEFARSVPDKSLWEQVSVDGYCYGIPFGNDTSFVPGFLMRSDLCGNLGGEAGKITSVEELEPLLSRVSEVYSQLIPVVPHYGRMENYISYGTQASGTVVTGESGYLSVADRDGFRQLCERMYRWHERGWILTNATLSDDSRSAWIGNELAFGSFARLGPYTQRQTEYETGMKLDCAYLGGRMDAGAAEANAFCVYAYSRDVELSLSLLRLIYTDPELRQMCVYGQEGVDYTLSGDGAALPGDAEPEGGRYISWYWPLLDGISPPMESADPFAQLDPVQTVDTFWAFDPGGVGVEVYQCGEVLDKYFDALCAGMLEPEEGIRQMRLELSAAGLEAVLEQVNRQWNERTK